MPDSKPANRLALEASPYLRQHAHNPVDWYPWGSEAFDKARREDKPIFLSIGYSTCHWCHVMEHESFDDEEVAAFLNDHFVAIKLDREQRPDLDDIYMTGVQMLNGHGGWPMSNFLTADGKPFFAGTYYPKAGFLSLLGQIVQVWRDRRADVLAQAEELSTSIARFTAAQSEARALPDGLCTRASGELLGRFDELNGGFGGAPKFPNESMLLLLLEDWQRNHNRRAREAITLTLDKMRQGGIYDQVGGGFHRYTVDAVWLVPHFEKMLYNQSQLVRVYARAARLFDNADWRRVVAQTVGYVLRDMRDGGGAFFSATDADSEGEEGLFFLWTQAELDAVLNGEDAGLVTALYGVTAAGNFEGSNILHLDRSLSDHAVALGVEEGALAARLDVVRKRLYDVREQRVHPLRDEKIITAWNAMMITSLAEAGFLLSQPDYTAAAEAAASWLWDHARDEQGSLWRIVFEGQRSIPGNLEDYACLAEAFLTLYRYGAGDQWLERGKSLVHTMISRFGDEASGGFFISNSSEEGPLITRPKSPMDGATPSANSVALSSLVLLNEVAYDPFVEDQVNRCLAAFGGLVAASPSAFSYMVIAAERYRLGDVEFVQFAGGGKIRVQALRVREGWRLDLSIADGWHINGSQLADAELIPTRVDAGGGEVAYPEGETYAGDICITVAGDANVVSIELQPCSGDMCLAPERLHFSG